MFKKSLLIGLFLFQIKTNALTISPCEYNRACRHLTYTEQVFARSLSPLHQDLFCKKFTQDQRIQAMSYADKIAAPDNADAAVERVLKEARGQLPTTQRPYSDYTPCPRCR